MSQIEELRRIIVGDNSEQLSELKKRVESIDARTKDVAEVLAPAINDGIKQNDDLIDALKLPVSEGLKQMIRSEPVEYAEILYPAISPSIRLAISQAISSLLKTINQTMESATSISGLRTRIESARSGIPYAELVLRKSLVYRVEHIYLIDRDTGLLIAECAAEDNTSLDSDAVSGMFSAIQSFVQDSFSGNETDRLTDLKVGEHNVWIAHGYKAMLACVILGDAPESLKQQLYASLDQIRVSYAQEISGFNGDTSGFKGVSELMQPLLQLRLSDAVEEVKEVGLASKFLILTIAALLIYSFWQWFDKRSKLATVQHYIGQTPGLVVTSSSWQADKIVVEGLQDPDAELPTAILQAHNINDTNLLMRTTPFRSLEADMELTRFSAQLNPLPELTLATIDGIPTLFGEATVEWLLQNDLRLRQLAIDGRLNIVDLNTSKESLHEYINKIIDGGSSGSEQPELEQVRIDMVNRISNLVLQRSWMDVPVSLFVPGNILNQYQQIWDQSEL